MKALQDRVAEVRFEAAYALGCIGDAQAIPALEQLAATDTTTLPAGGSVRREAKWAIRDIKQHTKEVELGYWT